MTTEVLLSLMGMVIAPVIAAVVSWWLNRDLKDEVRVTRRELATLKDERVVGIEGRLRSFETSCALKHDRLQETLTRVEHTAADVTNILGWTKKLDGKLDRIAEDAAASRSRVDGQDRWLQNLDNAHQAHVGDRELHNGR